MKLKEMMSPIDTFYEPSDSLLMVAKTLAEKHHSCGLICEYDKPVGIITERDIVRLLTGDAKPDLAIREVMTHRPICVDVNTELTDALDLAKSRNLRHLPVVDATQRLVGFVTLGV
ncbi:MAG: CBS domain-containing protein [Proteobacteria bacterium]|nr:CBS domain-containing protein [Pseudomonadota bacterium]